MHNSTRERRWWIVLIALIVLAAGCTTEEPNRSAEPRRTPRRNRPEATTPPPSQQDRGATPGRDLAPGYLLASSFETQVCGRWRRPRPGCEFGVEGIDTTAGDFRSRTGDGALRMQRQSPDHTGVLTEVPLPDGHGFVGVAVQVPAFPAGALPSSSRGPANIQLIQISPTDGQLPAMPVEVRLFPDRSIGLALHSDKVNTVMSDWKVPTDEWFYIVLEVTNGISAPQRMWLYDESDRLVDSIVARLDTRFEWRHGGRTAQKVGGTTSTSVPMFTYYDDWYVATRSMGPVHISPTGSPIDG
jgi:hypothetical protein